MAKCWCSCSSMRSCVLGQMPACGFVLSWFEGWAWLMSATCVSWFIPRGNMGLSKHRGPVFPYFCHLNQNLALLGQGGGVHSCAGIHSATCSDGLVNQGEHSVDCGGPCPPCGLLRCVHCNAFVRVGGCAAAPCVEWTQLSCQAVFYWAFFIFLFVKNVDLQPPSVTLQPPSVTQQRPSVTLPPPSVTVHLPSVTLQLPLVAIRVPSCVPK